MQIIINPAKEKFNTLTQRPARDATTLFDTVRPILEAVRERGDAALREFSERFDHCVLQKIQLNESEIQAAEQQVSPELREAIRLAHDNILRFHAAQHSGRVQVQTAPGILCEQRTLPIERVGLYVPGGSAPLFSTVLMLGVPARLAGCKEMILCTPPAVDGSVHPAIVYAASLCGITRICRVGGAQAIAALAYGTESVPKVDKIFGPGNSFVVAAKQLVGLSGVAIDMPAGPSEVLVYADSFCRPKFVAADLLSQAEHGPDSQVVLVTTERDVLERVMQEVRRQLEQLPRKNIAEQALEHSMALLFPNEQESIDFINSYAPEHLVLAVKNYRDVAERTTNAGSVFLGNYSCESAGDYASGTNHTLPTLGYTRAYSSLCLDSFMRKMTLQELTPRGISSIGRCVELMAHAEQLDAHRNAMSLRIAEAVKTQQDAVAEQDEQRNELLALVRPSIRSLKPYSSARDEYSGHSAHIFLDANESPYNSPYNRYPDPLQRELKEKLATQLGVGTNTLFLGNGSDEAIDLIYRIFCEPGQHNVLASEPTYGMYSVCAHINGVEYRSVPLDETDFSFSAEKLLASADACTRVIFLCSPNNPTGNMIDTREIEKVLTRFPGVVVVDEAYIDFAPEESLLPQLKEYPQLIILRTFSKAWASAGIRLGMALAHPDLITYFNRVKYPYNVNALTQHFAVELLAKRDEMDARVQCILSQRERMAAELKSLRLCRHVFPSAANFLLVRVSDAQGIYDALVQRGIIVRNRSRIALCAGCLRITIGSPQENDELLAALNDLDKSFSSSSNAS